MTRSVAIIGTRGYPSYYGGFETLVRILAPYLADEGWDVTVYGRRAATIDNDSARDPRIATVVTPGVETKSLSTLSYGLTASVDAAGRRPDVALVLNVANGYFLPLLRARGIPTVVNVDGIEWERAKWGTAAKRVFRTGASMTARWADHLVCDSLEIARHWGEAFGRAGTYIPYGGTRPTDPQPIPEFAPRSYALLVARLVPENSVAAFLDAAEKISREWDVVIVGSSGYPSELEGRVREMATTNQRIHWLGHVSDDVRLHALWRNAGVYFHGHSAGGTNPALVQAMACGAPIVARDTIFNREVLGGGGHFVAANGADIADALTGVLGDQAIQEALSVQAMQRQAAYFGWLDVCAGYDQLLTAAIDGHGRRRTELTNGGGDVPALDSPHSTSDNARSIRDV